MSNPSVTVKVVVDIAQALADLEELQTKLKEVAHQATAVSRAVERAAEDAGA